MSVGPERHRPTIVLLFHSAAEKARFNPFKLRSLLAETLIQGGELALVCAEDCAPEHGEIAGDVWDDGDWRRRPVERVDVAIMPGQPTLARHRAVRDWIGARCPLIEDVGPDKATLASHLVGTPLERHVVPQMLLDADEPRRRMADWLRLQGSAVLKPVDGNRGKGVQFIFQDRDGWSLHRGLETTAGTFDETVDRALAPIEGRLQYRAYVLQRYVRSVAPDGRALHIRIDVHKDGGGDWRVVAAAPRVAEIGYAISNSDNGGYVGILEFMLAGRRVRPACEIHDEILDLALSLGRTLDGRPGVRIKELGVDMGLDERDALWIFEANIQPQAPTHELQRARMTVEYSLALAKRAMDAESAPLYARGF